MLSLVEITAFRLESKSCKGFKKKSTNERTRIITGHVIYNPAYTYKFQLKTTKKDKTLKGQRTKDQGAKMVQMTYKKPKGQIIQVSKDAIK